MYCGKGQQTEEDMYNNEEGGPAFNEFLDCIGQRVRLRVLTNTRLDCAPKVSEYYCKLSNRN